MKPSSKHEPLPNSISDILRARQGRALDTGEVMVIFGLHRLTLHKWTKAGKIPYHRLGDRIKFDPAELAAWWEERRVA